MKKILFLVFATITLGGCSTPFSKYKENEFFDKKNFNAQQFGNDAKTCADEAKKIQIQDVNMPPQYGYAGAAISGFSEGHNQANAQRQFWLDCLFYKGYVIKELPLAVIKERKQTITDYVDKVNAEEKKPVQ